MLPQCLALFSVVLAALSLWRLPALHPLQLWSVPWAAATALFALHLLPYRALSPETTLLIGGALAIFGVGVLVATHGRLAGEGWRLAGVPRSDASLARAAVMALLLLALWLGLFLVQASVRYGVRDTLVSSSVVRLDLGAGALGPAIKYVYVSIAAAALCGLAAGVAVDRHARNRWLALLFTSAFSAYFSTGRSTIVLAGIAGLLAYGIAAQVELSRRSLLASIAAVGVLTLAVFLAGGAIIGKNIAAGDLGQVRSPFTDHSKLAPLGLPYQYASAPIAALDVQVDVAKHFGRSDGCASFAIACQSLRALGAPVNPEPNIPPFTAEPLTWNTYTALQPPLLDGGPGFVILFFWLAGLVVGALWHSARSGSAQAALLYSILGTAVVYAPTQDNFLAPHIVGAALVAAVLVAVSRRWDAVTPARLLRRLGGSGREPNLT